MLQGSVGKVLESTIRDGDFPASHLSFRRG